MVVTQRPFRYTFHSFMAAARRDNQDTHRMARFKRRVGLPGYRGRAGSPGLRTLWLLFSRSPNVFFDEPTYLERVRLYLAGRILAALAPFWVAGGLGGR